MKSQPGDARGNRSATLPAHSIVSSLSRSARQRCTSTGGESQTSSGYRGGIVLTPRDSRRAVDGAHSSLNFIARRRFRERSGSRRKCVASAKHDHLRFGRGLAAARVTPERRAQRSCSKAAGNKSWQGPQPTDREATRASQRTSACLAARVNPPPVSTDEADRRISPSCLHARRFRRNTQKIAVK